MQGPSIMLCSNSVHGLSCVSPTCVVQTEGPLLADKRPLRANKLPRGMVVKDPLGVRLHECSFLLVCVSESDTVCGGLSCNPVALRWCGGVWYSTHTELKHHPRVPRPSTDLQSRTHTHTRTRTQACSPTRTVEIRTRHWMKQPVPRKQRSSAITLHNINHFLWGKH